MAKPEIPKSVIRKLVFFTVAMIVAPLTTFFVVQNIFSKNAIYSGGAAALVANLVLVGYIIAAFTEDIEGDEKAKLRKKE